MNMRNNNDIHDEFLKKLIRQIPDDQPSDDFVAKVMKVIPATSLANKVEKSTSLKWWQWGLIAAAIVALGVLFIFSTYSNILYLKVFSMILMPFCI